jgi:hypothetical protein
MALGITIVAAIMQKSPMANIPFPITLFSSIALPTSPL